MSDYRCHFFLYRLFGISGSVPGRGLALVLLSNLSIVNLSMSSPGGSRSGSAEKLCKVTDFSGTAKTFRKFFSSPPPAGLTPADRETRGAAPRGGLRRPLPSRKRPRSYHFLPKPQNLYGKKFADTAIFNAFLTFNRPRAGITHYYIIYQKKRFTLI